MFLLDAIRGATKESAVRKSVLIIGSGPSALALARDEAARGRDVQLVRPAGRCDEPGSVANSRRGVQRFFGITELEWGRAQIADLMNTKTTVHVVTNDRYAVHLAREQARARGADCLVHAADTVVGSIALVGGGPGPADLLTIRAQRMLADADLVLVDRLAPRDELSELAPRALIVDVGKMPGHHPVPQGQIEQEIVAQAVAGARVVRLKGGDPFVLGRGGEEMAAARAAGIPVDVVPGVSSAIAVPAAAGIPVTSREVSRGFIVISGHSPLNDMELISLAGAGLTIVVLMGMMNLPHLSAGLARYGLSKDCPVAVVERGFTERQRTTISTLDTVARDCARIGVQSPAVIVIGEVVNLGLDAAQSLADQVGS